MRVLVVSANGQLGFRCCEGLARRGHAVRGSVRSPDRSAGLDALGVEVVTADLTSPPGLTAALVGVEAVVVTASGAAPRAGDDVERLQAGLERLVDDAAAADVRRFCLVSVPRTGLDHQVPLVRGKNRLESLAAASELQDVVLRFPPFMESWLALVGSELPLRGEPRATIGRPSPFLRAFRRVSGSTVERRGLMLVPGSPDNRNAFISVGDVARACVEAVERPEAAGVDLEVGGPEVLSWRDVATIYGDVLGRRVRTVSTPAGVYAAAASALRPVAAVPSATLALNRLIAASQTPWSPGGGGLLDPASMTTVRGFLSAKAALPAELPRVP